jgi:UDP-N-acetylglucosamine 1-carboxyvinyltransferase
LRALGAKNGALPLLAAALLVEDAPTDLAGVPDLSDVSVMIQILESLGAQVTVRPGADGQARLRIDARAELGSDVPPDLMARMRSSVFLLGPLLGRLGRACITYPGGCDIGARPIDLHLRGLARLGARIVERDGVIEALAPAGGLVGAEILLDLPSVGATENILMAAVRAKGETVIHNAACEPEIVDLARYLMACGALVEGAGERVVRVRGVNRLAGARHTVMPDRIETGTLLLAAATTGGEVRVEGAQSAHLAALTDVLRASGAEVENDERAMAVRGPADGRPLPIDVRTLPYPGFPTDLQPVLMAYLARSLGTSVIQETIFENRFRHASAFVRMGARIRVVGRTAVVDGVARLSGAAVEAGDLRAAGALVVAALAAEGVSEIAGLDHLERGYQDLGGRLAHLGAQVARDDAGAADERSARREAQVS